MAEPSKSDLRTKAALDIAAAFQPIQDDFAEWEQTALCDPQQQNGLPEYADFEPFAACWDKFEASSTTSRTWAQRVAKANLDLYDVLIADTPRLPERQSFAESPVPTQLASLRTALYGYLEMQSGASQLSIHNYFADELLDVTGVLALGDSYVAGVSDASDTESHERSKGKPLVTNTASLLAFQKPEAGVCTPAAWGLRTYIREPAPVIQIRTAKAYPNSPENQSGGMALLTMFGGSLSSFKEEVCQDGTEGRENGNHLPALVSFQLPGLSHGDVAAHGWWGTLSTWLPIPKALSKYKIGSLSELPGSRRFEKSGIAFNLVELSGRNGYGGGLLWNPHQYRDPKREEEDIYRSARTIWETNPDAVILAYGSMNAARLLARPLTDQNRLGAEPLFYRYRVGIPGMPRAIEKVDPNDNPRLSFLKGKRLSLEAGEGETRVLIAVDIANRSVHSYPVYSRRSKNGQEELSISHPETGETLRLLDPAHTYAPPFYTLRLAHGLPARRNAFVSEPRYRELERQSELLAKAADRGLSRAKAEFPEGKGKGLRADLNKEIFKFFPIIGLLTSTDGFHLRNKGGDPVRGYIFLDLMEKRLQFELGLSVHLENLPDSYWNDFNQMGPTKQMAIHYIETGDANELVDLLKEKIKKGELTPVEPAYDNGAVLAVLEASASVPKSGYVDQLPESLTPLHARFDRRHLPASESPGPSIAEAKPPKPQ